MVSRQIMAFYVCSCLLLCWGGCGHNQVQEYVLTHRDQPAEILVALSSGRVINGMNEEQVRLLIGDPLLKEQLTPQIERWIYRNLDAGMKQAEAYEADSAFPQGIGFVIPLHYRAQEIFVDFAAGKVCRVEQILSY